MTLLIDADAVAYRAAVVNERDERFDERTHVLWSDFEGCKHIAGNILADLCHQADTDVFILFWSKGANFRHTVDPSYKNHRLDRKPLAYARLVEWMQDQYESIEHDTLEADDAIGIYATDPENQGDELIIWSPDKDLRQIPAFHLDNDEVIEILPSEGYEWFITQVLTGDTADGYKGCPGVGPAGAKRIIAAAKFDERPLWDAVLEAYSTNGLSPDDAIRQARLAYILQHGDYENGEVRLWKPTNI